MQEKFLLFEDVKLNEIINYLFWLFSTYCLGHCLFSQFFNVFLRKSKIKYYKRHQFSRTIWNISFFAASSLFLNYYHENVILPQIFANTGKLFPTYDSQHKIFYLGPSCDRFKMYTLLIIAFYLHSSLLDFKENDFCEGGSKILYTMSIITLIGFRFEHYFVILNLNLAIFNIITECLFLFALQTSNCSRLVHQILLGFRIASWSHIYISLLPFKYLLPTLFAKNFKLLLNIFIWLWYGLSIWNSPVLQYFYHQIYHTNPTDCAGEGSAAKCILLKDSVEHRHFKTLRKCYLEVKLSNKKLMAMRLEENENASSKAFQAIKCIMTLKRKLRKMRAGREQLDDKHDTTTGQNSTENDSSNVEH